MTLKLDDMDLLERTLSMYVLLAIDAHPGVTMREIMRLEEKKERTKFVRMTELIEAGLVYKAESDVTKQGVFLTPEGERVVSHIKKIRLELLRLQKAKAEQAASEQAPESSSSEAEGQRRP